MKANSKLDWSTGIGQKQYEAIERHYKAVGGPDALNRYRFVRFMRNHRPDALPRWRLVVNSVTGGVGLEDPLPFSCIAMIMCHFYVTLPYPQGVRLDIEAAKIAGASKTQVADILALGWLHSGPFGMNVSSTVSEEFFDSWDTREVAPGVAWPSGWSVDRDVFKSGIDFESSNDSNLLTYDERQALEQWHLANEGSIPSFVSFLIKYYPLGLKVFRARYENIMACSLPKQLIALCRVHLSATWMQPEALHRALFMARKCGVSKNHVVQILTLVQQYRGDIAMDSAVKGAEEFLDQWN